MTGDHARVRGVLSSIFLARSKMPQPDDPRRYSMTKVFVAHDPVEAHFVKGLLEREGIAAEVHGEALFNLRPRIGIESGSLPTIWVSEDEQLERAREVVAKYECGKGLTRPRNVRKLDSRSNRISG